MDLNKTFLISIHPCAVFSSFKNQSSHCLHTVTQKARIKNPNKLHLMKKQTYLTSHFHTMQDATSTLVYRMASSGANNHLCNLWFGFYTAIIMIKYLSTVLKLHIVSCKTVAER